MLKEERDRQVLRDIYCHKLLNRLQIQQLYFESLQTANRCLRRLRDREGLLDRIDVPGEGGHIYYVKERGYEVLQTIYPGLTERVGYRPLKKKLRLTEHTAHLLAENQFWIDLRIACRSGDIELIDYLPEHYPAMGTVSAEHRPDGAFVLRKDNRHRLFYLEIDRGTETAGALSSQFSIMLGSYRQLAQSRIYQRYAERIRIAPFGNFRMLLVTTSERRVAYIRRSAAASKVLGPLIKFVWITTFGQLTADTILSPVWQILDPGEDGHYAFG